MSIIINDVNTRKEVSDLKDRVTTLENSSGGGGTGTDKYLQNVELEHISGGETVKPTNLTIAYNNCTYTDSSNLLTLNNPTHEVTTTGDVNGVIGDITTAAAPANGADASNYWFITQLSGFVPMIGKKIKSMTMKANTTGTVTFAGSTVAAGYTSTDGSYIGNLYAQVKNASQDMFTLTVTQGTSTYLFDGTDSRVTFLNGLTEFIMPTTLGVRRDVSCGIMHNNTGTNSLVPRTGDDTDVLYGFIQNGSNPISYTPTGYQSFALNFVYEDTITVIEDTGLRPVVTFSDDDLIVETNGAGGYVIFAEGTDGYGVVSGAGNVYWISKTTTDITQISGLTALEHAPVLGLKLQDSSTLDITYNDSTTTMLLATVNNAFSGHTMNNFVFGFSRGLEQSDISNGKLGYDFEGTYIENPTDRIVFTMSDGSHIYCDLSTLVNPN